MLKSAYSLAAIALLSATAEAADLPVYEEPAPMPATVEQAAGWSGFYVGAHGGYSWAEADVDVIGTIDDFDGGLVGGQLGVNWQWNMLVLGVEGDASWTFADTSVPLGGATVNVEEEWIASARGRLGAAFERFFVYGTGGAAWVGIDVDVPGVGSDDNTHFGWVAGGGGEVMVTRNVSVGVEFLHYEFDEETYNIGGAAVAGDGDAEVVRGRVNWKFGG
jgi:outer membrane immunogenic protein